MAEPVIRFGRQIPQTLQEWDQVLRDFARFVQKVGAEFVLSEDTVLPTNETLIDGVRAFLPPPPAPAPSIESQMMAVRAFERPMPMPQPEANLLTIRAFERPDVALPPVNDSQAILANQIFGAR